jgi:hypothetical protein
MVFVKWLIVGLVVLNAGYLAVDGTRALVTGNYITPSSGQYAGQLGPWANLVRSIGIDPMSTAMKLIFVIFGLAWLVVLGFFLADAKWAPTAMLCFAIGSLWYLWIGTMNSAIQIVLLMVIILRAPR